MSVSFTYQDEESIDKSLQCPICIAPLVEPVFHKSCKNTFCKGCLTELDLCPMCRSPASEVLDVPNIIPGFLSKLKVICPECKGVMQRGVLYDHVDKCPTSCPDGCEERVAPRDREAHRDKCTEVIVKCTAADVGCSWNYKRRLQADHESQCDRIRLRPCLLEIAKLEQRVVAFAERERELTARVEELSIDLLQQRDPRFMKWTPSMISFSNAGREPEEDDQKLSLVDGRFNLNVLHWDDKPSGWILFKFPTPQAFQNTRMTGGTNSSWKIQCSDDCAHFKTVAKLVAIGNPTSISWAPCGSHKFWRYLMEANEGLEWFRGYEWW